MDRRTVVAGLVAVGGSAGLGLTGCGARGGDATPSAESADADRRLVAAALEAESAAVAALERARRRHPSLRGATGQALQTHRDHVGLLRGAVDGASSRPAASPPVPDRPAAALRALARREAEVSAAHVSTAMAARSGSLARVVASMSVAAAQLEQVLADRAAQGDGT